MARGATSILHQAKSVRRQPAFSPLDKSRRIFLFAFLSLIVLTSACAIFYIGTHIQAVNLGYKISQELQRKEELIEENKRLSLEIARLKSPIRIEAEAKETLGLQLPKTQQVFYLSRWEQDAPAQFANAAPIKPLAEKTPPKISEVPKTIANKSEGRAKPKENTSPTIATSNAAKALPSPTSKVSDKGQVAKAEKSSKSQSSKTLSTARSPEGSLKDSSTKTAQVEKRPPEKSSNKAIDTKPIAKIASAPENSSNTQKASPEKKNKNETTLAAKPSTTPKKSALASSEKPATVAKKSESAKSTAAKADTKTPAAKSSAKPGTQDTRVAKREGSSVLVAKIVEKETPQEKNSGRTKTGATPSFQAKDKVPAVMLDPIP